MAQGASALTGPLAGQKRSGGIENTPMITEWLKQSVGTGGNNTSPSNWSNQVTRHPASRVALRDGIVAVRQSTFHFKTSLDYDASTDQIPSGACGIEIFYI